MRVHITNIHGMIPTSVAMIAQNTITQIGNELGFNELGIYAYPYESDTKSELIRRFDGIIASVEPNDTVIFQSPSWNPIEFDLSFCYHLKDYFPNLNLVVYIQDIFPLMFENNRYLLPKFIELYELAEVLILPSRKMYDFLRKNGMSEKKYVIYEVFDHPLDKNILVSSDVVNSITFIGDPTKFTVTGRQHPAVSFEIFSDKHPETSGENIHYHDKVDDKLLPSVISGLGGFGLVWRTDKSKGYDKIYDDMYVPYKLGTYLSANLPVIVPKELASAPLIEKNNLGFTVSDLDEAFERVAKITPEEYQGYKRSVLKFSPLVQQGYFTKHVLIEAVRKALLA